MLLLLALLLPAGAWGAESVPVSSQRAIVTLVSETDAVAPGTPYRIGLRMRLAPGWHTYWRNPGDAGVAPELEFTLPAGVTAGPIAWPFPSRQPEDTLMTYGYSGEVLLAATISGGPGPVRVAARWLVCSKICVPEEGEFTLDLPAGPPRPAPEAALFADADAHLPQPALWPATVTQEGVLTLVGTGLPAVTDAWFIPDAPETIVPSAKQPVETAEGRLALGLRPGASFRTDAPLTGLVVMRDRGGHETALSISATPSAGGSLPLWHVLGLAVLGGLVLNLMPCVFPILAMKAVALANMANQGRGRACGHAISYAAGVLVTFAVVAFALIALRQAGDATGWGFQFQSPLFVAGMAVVLFAVGLNLSGVYAVRAPVIGGHRLAGQHGHVGSFFSGLLAVLVATPCTAPFMGVAVTAGLAGTPATTLAVFAAMGVGLAAPYVILASLPGVARLLPRPGRWMAVLQQFLAFPMYGAAAWLAWVLSLQAGAAGVLALAAAFVLAGMAAWALGLAQHGVFRRFAITVAALAFAGAAASVASVSPSAAEAQADSASERFTPARLAALRAEGKPVFVNVTAAWCVSCLVNERVALGTTPVRTAFAAAGITYLKGDWTRPDPEITAYLRAAGRDGVPLYVFYPAGGRPAVTLPQLLTPDIVRAAIDAKG